MTVLLGRTSGGTSADFSAGGNTAVWKFVAVASGNLLTLYAQTKVANTATSGKLGIYAHDAVNNRPVNAAPLGSAAVTTANFNGTAVHSATLGSPVAITSGTTYWLGWYSAGADSRNFQGDSSGEYYEASGDFPAATPANWTGPSSVNAIIWGEDAGGSDATVTAVPAGGTGAFPVATLSAGATVTAPPADGTGDFPADMPISAGITAPPADGLGDFPVPGVSAGATVSDVPADGNGDFPAPAVTGAAGATVSAPPADAVGDFPIPTRVGPAVDRLRRGRLNTGAVVVSGRLTGAVAVEPTTGAVWVPLRDLTGAAEVSARLTGALEPAHATGANEAAHYTGANEPAHFTGAVEVDA
jgi:hypothetical protein